MFYLLWMDSLNVIHNTMLEQNAKFDSFKYFGQTMICEHTCTATVSRRRVYVHYFSIKGLLVELFGWRTGHPWNAGKASWRSLCQRRAPTLQQELPVVDDPSTCLCRNALCVRTFFQLSAFPEKWLWNE